MILTALIDNLNSTQTHFFVEVVLHGRLSFCFGGGGGGGGGSCFRVIIMTPRNNLEWVSKCRCQNVWMLRTS